MNAPYHLPTALGHGSSLLLSKRRINVVMPFRKVVHRCQYDYRVMLNQSGDLQSSIY